MNNTIKITVGIEWGDNSFVVWRGVNPIKAFDTRVEAQAYAAKLKADL